MNRTWQIILAIFAFLACTAFGAVGGCTAGFIGGLSVAEGGKGGASPVPHAGEQAGVVFFVLLAAGGLVGLALGLFAARQILKVPPR